MKHTKIPALLIFAFIIPAFFNSCMEENEGIFTVYADAYVIKKLDEAEPVYANAYYVYGNSEIQSARVSAPGGSEIALQVSESAFFTFMKEPETPDFMSDVPQPGDYLFEVTSGKGEVVTATDFLEYTGIAVPVITSTEYKKNEEILEIKWDPVPGIDGLVVKLIDTSGNLVYLGYQLDWEATEYQIDRLFGNWQTDPKFGRSYAAQVHAFAYESGVEDQEQLIYNLREVSVGEKTIVWGQ
jgi:hypothetical protein